MGRIIPGFNVHCGKKLARNLHWLMVPVKKKAVEKHLNGTVEIGREVENSSDWKAIITGQLLSFL